MEKLAGRFAAKEAVLKLMGTGWRGKIAWTDIEGYYTLRSVPVTDHAFALVDMWGQAIERDGVKYSRGNQFVGPFNITPGAVVEAPNLTMLVAGTLKGQVSSQY